MTHDNEEKRTVKLPYTLYFGRWNFASEEDIFITGHPVSDADYVPYGKRTIVVEVTIPSRAVQVKAQLEKLDATITKEHANFQVKLEKYEEARQKLLALTYDTEIVIPQSHQDDGISF